MQKSMERRIECSAEQFKEALPAEAGDRVPLRCAIALRPASGRRSRHRRLPLAVAILAAIGMLPALTGGWQLDDYFQRVTLLGYGDSKPINTFIQYIDRAHNLRQMDSGTLPWWGSPDLHQAFLRYASTLTMMLDYRLWPNHPALMHLHSLLWLSAAVLAAALFIVRCWVPPG